MVQCRLDLLAPAPLSFERHLASVGPSAMAPVPFIDDGAPAQGVGVLNRDGFLFGFLTGWGASLDSTRCGRRCVCVGCCRLVRGRCGQEAKVAGFVCVCGYIHARHAYICSYTHVNLDNIYIYIRNTL